MKTTLIRYAIIISLSAAVLSCGSSKKAVEAERKKKERKEKTDQMDQDKRRFEMQNNKDLK